MNHTYNVLRKKAGLMDILQSAKNPLNYIDRLSFKQPELPVVPNAVNTLNKLAPYTDPVMRERIAKQFMYNDLFKAEPLLEEGKVPVFSTNLPQKPAETHGKGVTSKKKGMRFKKGMKIGGGILAGLGITGAGSYAGYSAYKRRKEAEYEQYLRELQAAEEAATVAKGEKQLRAMGIGAGIGGLSGVGLGYALSRKNKGRNALLAGLAGAGLGAGAGALWADRG